MWIRKNSTISEKITLKDSKAEIQYFSGDDFDGTVLKNFNGVAFRDFQDETLFSISSNIYAYNKRIINLGDPVDENDAANKKMLIKS